MKKILMFFMAVGDRDVGVELQGCIHSVPEKHEYPFHLSGNTWKRGDILMAFQARKRRYNAGFWTLEKLWNVGKGVVPAV